MYREEDYLQLSGIQHFAFCRRQWALIHVEQQWEENFHTADGRLMHENAHNSEFREKRGNIIIIRGMRVSSAEYGISGECDVVELHRDDQKGININGLEGNYIVKPIEYKRGTLKSSDCDYVQLCAQVLCLEEMLCCDIKEGCLYYGQPKKRTVVLMSETLRAKTKQLLGEMHELYKRKYTPKVHSNKSCNSCSLKNICVPEIEKRSALTYIHDMINERSDL